MAAKAWKNMMRRWRWRGVNTKTWMRRWRMGSKKSKRGKETVDW